MREENGQERTESLQKALHMLRRRVVLIVLCAAVVPGAAIAFSLLSDKQYTAKATLLFRDPQLDQKLFGSSFVQQNTDEAREAATNLELVSLDVVAARTVHALGRSFTG